MQSKQYAADIHGRAVVLERAESLGEAIAGLRAPSTHFVLVIAGDTANVRGPDLVDNAAALIGLGASYICCWGPDCERFHDCFDEADWMVNGESSDGRVLMTTWHSDEPLQEAIWFGLNSAIPSASYESATRAVVILCVGNASCWEQASSYLDAGAPLLDEA
jgi:hypothetical protein